MFDSEKRRFDLKNEPTEWIVIRDPEPTEWKVVSHFPPGIVCDSLKASCPGERMFGPYQKPFRSLKQIARELIRAGLADEQVAEHVGWVGGRRYLDPWFIAQQIAEVKKETGA